MAGALKRSSLTDQATQAIIDLIAERNLKQGDALPGTGDLAELLSVSVPVIREAIAGLSALGLLKRQQGRESIISAPDSSHMSRLMQLRIVGTDVDDEELQQFREIMEVGNARLAARHRTPDDLALLEDALESLRAATRAEDLHARDVAFHAAVATAAHNDLCKLTLDGVEPLLHRLRRRVWNGWVQSGGNVDPIIEAHAAVLDAIRAGDESGAAHAMAEHLSQARAGLEQTIRVGESEPDPAAGFTPRESVSPR